jgi:hypothetical protein
MLNTKLSTEARNQQLRAFAELLNGGMIRVYDGKQPANPETSVDGQKLLATLKFSIPAFATPSNGTVTANKIEDDPNAPETGTASWARLVKADGSVVMDGSVGKKDANIVMGSVSISAGARVSIASLSVNLPMSGDK